VAIARWSARSWNFIRASVNTPPQNSITNLGILLTTNLTKLIDVALESHAYLVSRVDVITISTVRAIIDSVATAHISTFVLMYTRSTVVFVQTNVAVRLSTHRLSSTVSALDLGRILPVLRRFFRSQLVNAGAMTDRTFTVSGWNVGVDLHRKSLSYLENPLFVPRPRSPLRVHQSGCMSRNSSSEISK
jgi:hypothetical protein